MKFTHHCETTLQTKDNQDIPPNDQEPVTPSVVWIDSSWHRLQGLAPVFGDTIPGGRNGIRNTARCAFGKEDEDSNEKVWLSLWLLKWREKPVNPEKSFKPRQTVRLRTVSDMKMTATVTSALNGGRRQDKTGAQPPRGLQQRKTR